MSPKIDNIIIKTVKHLLKIGENTVTIKNYIRSNTGLGKTQVNQNFNEIKNLDYKETSEEEISAIDLDDDNIEINAKHYGLKTLDELLDRCNINKEDWEVKSFRPNSWPANTCDGVVIFSQVKAYLERKISKKTRINIDDLKEDLKKSSLKVPRIHVSAKNDGSRLLEICLFDLHLGKLGFKDQVGNNYSIEIAKKLYLEALVDIVQKTLKGGKIDRICFPVGNDYLNVDNSFRTTTAGTPQDCDSTFPFIFREGRKLLIQAIDTLKIYAPVDVVVVCGNHDSNGMFHIGDALECWYHNDENVTVDNGIKSRKYYSYGENLILYTHGDKEKMEKLPLIAATEEPALWANSKYREIRVGHLHHEIVKEFNGVKVRVVPSLSGNDVYHYDRGYVGNIRVGQGFIFDKEDGLESIIYSRPACS